MELTISVKDDYVTALARALDVSSDHVLVEALRVLDWVVEKRKMGKLIVACDPNGNNAIELETPNMRNIKAA